MAGFINTSEIKMGFWIGAGLFAFGLVAGLLTHAFHK